MCGALTVWQCTYRQTPCLVLGGLNDIAIGFLPCLLLHHFCSGQRPPASSASAASSISSAHFTPDVHSFQVTRLLVRATMRMSSPHGEIDDERRVAAAAVRHRDDLSRSAGRRCRSAAQRYLHSNKPCMTGGAQQQKACRLSVKAASLAATSSEAPSADGATAGCLQLERLLKPSSDADNLHTSHTQLQRVDPCARTVMWAALGVTATNPAIMLYTMQGLPTVPRLRPHAASCIAQRGKPRSHAVLVIAHVLLVRATPEFETVA